MHCQTVLQIIFKEIISEDYDVYLESLLFLLLEGNGFESLFLLLEGNIVQGFQPTDSSNILEASEAGRLEAVVGIREEWGLFVVGRSQFLQHACHAL